MTCCDWYKMLYRAAADCQSRSGAYGALRRPAEARLPYHPKLTPRLSKMNGYNGQGGQQLEASFDQVKEYMAFCTRCVDRCMLTSEARCCPA